MDVLECLREAHASGEDFQGAVNAFVDDFRRATPAGRSAAIAQGPQEAGRLEGLLAAPSSAPSAARRGPASPIGSSTGPAPSPSSPSRPARSS